MSVKALASILTRKNEEEHILFFDAISMDVPKTKQALLILEKAYEVLKPKGNKKTGIIVSNDVSGVLKKSFANIPNINIIPVSRLNASVAHTYPYLFFFDANETLSFIEKRCV